VLYFARLREAVGRERETLELPADVATVGALRQWLITRGAPWAEAFTGTRRIRAAVAQDMAADETRLSEGAEVAFFPPVTGG
jgi:molybdopterin synthase sulfur carrier subunit